MAFQYLVRSKYSEILQFLDVVRSHADAERNALGFIPAPAYEEAARQGKLIVLLASDTNRIEYAGHLLYGGVFPQLRVRQICVAPKYRGRGNATTLLRTLRSKGEADGYLSIVANVATDLQLANSFYEKNGFATQRLKSGGLSRNRTINVRTLQLETPSLISMMDGSTNLADLIRPKARSADVPLYAIDLNVFFDVIRARPRSEDAGALFKAALSHQIRLAASDEFVRELERRSHAQQHDPVLALAKQIPNLPTQIKSDIETLRLVVTAIVFPDSPSALTESDQSDVLHICHAITAGAAGYITSDKRILAARDSLMSGFTLDVIGLTEFVELLDLPPASAHRTLKSTGNFYITASKVSEVTAFLASENVKPDNFLRTAIQECQRICIADSDGVIGTAILAPAPALDGSSRLLICARQDHPYSSTIVDFLISEQLRLCSLKQSCTVVLFDIPNHPITRRIALTHGFQKFRTTNVMTKVALGHPVTLDSWSSSRLVVERLGELRIQERCPRYDNPVVEVASSKGRRSRIPLVELETLLSPTLFALPQRKAVVVPITKDFANALLGTQAQLSFLEVPEAQFLSRRTYFNTIRATNVMIRGSAIAFYESVRSGGRGAIVAVGRIVDVTTVSIENVPEFMQRAAVVEDLQEITKANRILATTFDNLLQLKTPVTFESLRKINCVPSSNFISATSISATQLQEIVRVGFPDE